MSESPSSCTPGAVLWGQLHPRSRSSYTQRLRSLGCSLGVGSLVPCASCKGAWDTLLWCSKPARAPPLFYCDFEYVRETKTEMLRSTLQNQLKNLMLAASVLHAAS